MSLLIYFKCSKWSKNSKKCAKKVIFVPKNDKKGPTPKILANFSNGKNRKKQLCLGAAKSQCRRPGKILAFTSFVQMSAKT